MARKEQRRRLRVLFRVLVLLGWVAEGYPVEAYWLPSAGDMVHAMEFTDHGLTLAEWQAALVRADRDVVDQRDQSGHKVRRRPKCPTSARPGSREKLRVMRERYRR